MTIKGCGKGLRTGNAQAPAPVVVYRFHEASYRPAPELLRKHLAGQLNIDAHAQIISGIEVSSQARDELARRMVTLAYGGTLKSSRALLDRSWRPSFADPVPCSFGPCTPTKDAFWRAFIDELQRSAYWRSLAARDD